MPKDKPVVLFDASRLINRLFAGTPTGIDRVDLEYCKFLLDSEAYKVKFIGYGKRGHFIIPPILVKMVIRRFVASDRAHWVVNRLWGKFSTWFSFKIYRLLRWSSVVGFPLHPEHSLKNSDSNAVYINVSHGKMTKAYRFKWLRTKDVKCLFFVHDLIPIINPEFCTKKQESRHRARLKTITTYADLVVCISEYTKQEFSGYIRSQGLIAPTIEVLPLAVDGLCDAKPSPMSVLEGSPFFVVLSTIEPRKNHLILLKVWSKLVSESGKSAPRLFIIGRRGWKNNEVFEWLDNDAMSVNVSEMSGLSDGHVKTLLQGARALLSPSFTEGFGLPVVEALRMGVPVIASDIPSHREVGKGVPLFIKADDLDKWYSSILEYSNENSDARHEQMQRMKDFSVLSWPEHMKLFEDLLINKVLSN